jgi:PAS domain S-box-containing protein
MSAHCAFIVEFTNARTSASPLAFWCNGKLIAAEPYALAGTPCECVLAGDIVGFERNVAELFPEDRLALKNIEAESFLAIPLKDRANLVVGHVAVIDRHSRAWDDADHDMLRLFAARATTEIEHRRFEQELEASRAELAAKMVDRTRELEAANARLQREIERERDLALKLEDSEARYRSLFDNSPISIWEIDLSEVRERVEAYKSAGVHDLGAHFRAHPDEAVSCSQLLRVREVNQATLSIYRAPDATVLQDWTNTVVLPESYGPLSTAIVDLSRGARHGAIDIVHKTMDGERKNLAVRWSLLPGEELTWSRVLCCVVDVTEETRATEELEAARAELEQRVVERTAALSAANTRLRHEIGSRLKAEHALREQEEQYRDLYENAPNVFYSVNTKGYIERANRQAERFFGCELKDIVGHPVWNRMAPGPTGEGAARRAFNRFLEGKSTYGVEVEYRHHDGRSLWATLNVEPVLDADGQPVVTRSVITDITARKIAEMALERRRALEQLVTNISTSLAAATTSELDRVLDSVTAELGAHGAWDIVCIERRHGARHERKRHVWRNVADSDVPVFFVDRTERVLIPNVATLPQEDAALRTMLERAGLRAYVQLPLEHGERVLGALELVSFATPHDNVVEDVQLISVLSGLIATTLVRCEAEDELVGARKAAEAASRAKSEFLANMSHELRTPLNAVLGYAQLLQRDATLGAPHQDAVRSVRRSGEHLLTLINDVLDLARVESGRVDIARREVDLRVLVAEVDEMFRVRANEAAVEYTSTVSRDLPGRVWTDDRRLRQILINLLGNAMKFTPAGATVSLDVVSEPTSNGAHVRFDVRDAGIGIRREDFERIFEPFQQVGELRRDGAGLGLSITRQLVHAMNGTIEVESEPGKGSRFSVGLHLEAAAERAVVSAPISAVIGYAGPRRRVLVADDRAENRALLSAFLRPLGFDVDEAVDGEATVAAVRRRFPDVLFVDLVMPIIDGFEAVRRIRRLPGGEALKIVAISASAFEHTRSASLSSGCDDFIVKPLNLERVLGVLKDQLGLEWLEAAPQESERTTEGPLRLPDTALRALSVAAHSGDIMEIEALLDTLAREHGTGGIVGRLRELVRRFDVRGIESALAALGGDR